MGTYQQPGNKKTLDYSSIGKGLGAGSSAYAAGIAAGAKAKAAQAAAAAKASAKADKLAAKKRSAIHDLDMDLSSKAKFNNTKVQAAYQEVLENQLGVLAKLEYNSDDWNTQVKAITNMVGSSKLGIELVNTEYRDYKDVYQVTAGSNTLSPISSHINGGPLATNDPDMVDLIKDYGSGGAGIKFEGGSYIDANNKLVVNTNLTMNWTEQNTAAGTTPRTATLSFQKYNDVKDKGYDIIGRTNGEAFKIMMNGQKDLYFDDNYHAGFTEEVKTSIQQGNGTYTEETIKSYSDALSEEKAKFDSSVGDLKIDQSSWQLLGGNGQIDPNDAGDRIKYADLLWKKLEDENAISDKSKFNIKDLEKSDQFTIRINSLRGKGIGGFGKAQNTKAFQRFDAAGLDPNTGQAWANNVPANKRIPLSKRGHVNPKQLKVIAKNIQSHGTQGISDLADLMTQLNTKGYKYKSGQDAKNDIQTSYEAEYTSVSGDTSPSQDDILKFAAGKYTDNSGNVVTPASGVYYGADQIQANKLFDMTPSKRTAIPLPATNEDQIYELILKQMNLSPTEYNYIVNNTRLKNPKVPKAGTVVKTK